MAEQRETPYTCHIFICTNDRHGTRKSCADSGGAEIRAALKEAVAARGWKGRVRVSQAGCFGLCDDGPNVVLYPQEIWFFDMRPADVDRVLARVAEILGEPV